MKPPLYRFRNHVLLASCIALTWLPATLDSDGIPPGDRDGDGSPDAAEHFLGTDGDDRESAFKIREVMRLQGPSKTRLRWPSTAGRSYRIEATQDINADSWQAVATVTGTGGLMEADLPDDPSANRKFFRIETDYDTALPPWIGQVAGPQGTVSTAGFQSLRVQAWHPLGIEEVVFRRGNRILGAGVQLGDGVWEYQWPVDFADNGETGISAEARRGNGTSVSLAVASKVEIALPPQPAFLSQHPDQFVLLDSSGNPLPGRPVRSDALGNLPPCEFRPLGFSPRGNDFSLAIRLPQGARIAGTTTNPTLEFSSSRLVSGLIAPLAVNGVIQTSSPKSLALGPVSVSQLVSLYSLPGGGIPVSIFGKFPAQLKAGVLESKGLVAPLIELATEITPIGQIVGGFENHVADLMEQGFLQLPIQGTYPLAQYGGPPATLTLGGEQPGWVRFGFDGSLSFTGRAALAFNNGPAFEVGLTWIDPLVAFDFKAKKLHAKVTANWLGDLLPSAVAVDGSTTASLNALDTATRDLTNKGLLFKKFAITFKPSSAGTTPRREQDAGSSPAEIIGLAKIANATGITATAAELREAIHQSARAASAAANTPAAAAQWFHLEKIRMGSLTSTELTNARNESRAALKRRLEGNIPLSLDDLDKTLAIALERQKLAQQTATPFDHDNLESAFVLAIENTLDAFAATLDASSGTPANPSQKIAARDRFVLYQDINTLARLNQTIQLLGLPLTGSVMADSLLPQIAAALEPKLRQALRDAETRNDEMAFQDALFEYLFLIRENDLGSLGNASISLLSADSLAARVGAMAEAVASLPRPARPVAKRFAEVERIGKILASIPVSVTFPADPVQRAYDGLQDAVTPAFSFLSSATSNELLDILRAGNAAVLVRDRMNFPAGSPAWEHESRLPALCTELAARCVTEDLPATAWAAVGSILAVADSLAEVADQPRRKLYLLEAQKFVTSMRAIALSRKNSGPLATADALLVGGVAIDEIAGGFSYDFRAKNFNGNASGKVRLPGIDSSFTLTRATFSNQGAFDLECFGSVTLPPGPDAPARFSVTERRPLRIAWEKGGNLAVSGGGKMEVNGMTFEAWASADDPEYVFGAAFSGIDFQLANSLRVMVPTPPATGPFTAAANRDLNRWFRSASSSFENLVEGAVIPPEFRSPGQAPGQDDLGGESPYQALAAWARTEIADQSLGTPRDHSAVTPIVLAQLEQLGTRMDILTPAADCSDGLSSYEAATALEVIDLVETAVEIKAAKVPPEPVGPLGNALLSLRNQEKLFVECIFGLPNRYTLEVENLAFAALNRHLRVHGDILPEGVHARPEWLPVFEAANDYHQRTLAEALAMAGINPMTGLPDGDGSTLALIDTAELRAHIINFFNRRSLASIGNDGGVPFNPAVDYRFFGEQVELTLWLEYRKRLIVEGWQLSESLPDWPVGVPGGFSTVTPEAAVSLRAYGEHLRKFMLEWLAFRRDFAALGLEGAVGSRPVLDPVTRTVGSWNPANDGVFDSGPLNDLSNRYDARGIPQLVVQFRIPGFGDTLRAVRSQPIEEGMRGISKPLTAYSEDERKSILSRGLLTNISLETPTPDLAAATEKYEMARQGVFPQSSTLPRPAVDAMIAQIQAYGDRFESTPPASRDTVEGLGVARDLRFLALMVETTGATDARPALEADILSFDTAFKAACLEQKTWSALAAYTDIWIEGSVTKVNGVANASAGFFAQLGSDSLRTAISLVGNLGALLPGSQPVDLALPGSLRVDQAAGEVRYNRATNHLAATFSGSLAFPDIDARFNLTNLALDTEGKLTLSANTSGPLPGRPEVRLTGSVDLAGKFRPGIPGSPPVSVEQLAVAGTGSATLPGGGTIDGVFTYDTSSEVLELSATGEHLDLSLGDHFALLSGNARLRFGGLGPDPFPSSGLVELGGTFGLMRKSAPPPGQQLTEDHFHLTAVEALTRFEIDSTGMTASIPTGKLRLPSYFSSPPVPPATQPNRAEIAINPSQAPSAVFAFGTPTPEGLPTIQSLTLSGGVLFSNIGLNLPDFPEVTAEDFDGSFDFGSLQLGNNGVITGAEAPRLQIANGLVTLPHPSDGEPIEIAVSDIDWQLDGFPSGTIGLQNDVTVFEDGGFRFIVRGGEVCGPGQPATGIRVHPSEIVNGLPQVPRVELFGAVMLRLDSSVMTKESGSGEPNPSGVPETAVAGSGCGTITLYPDRFPSFHWTRVAIGGRFRLGGPDGVAIVGVDPGTDASITFNGLENIFSLDPTTPFTITLNGKFLIPDGPGFGLQDTHFVFDQNGALPRFFPGTLVYDASQWELANMGIVNVTEAKLTFIENLNWPDIIRPTNLAGEISIDFGLPNTSQQDRIIGGTARDVKVTWSATGQPIFSLDGIGFEVNPGFKIPPLNDIGGKFYIGGLSDPSKLTIAGRFNGSMKNYKLAFVGGFGLQGPLGFAIDVNAGEAGIPIGGPTGIIFTGASGGYSFVSDNADPSDFSSYAIYNPTTDDYRPLSVGALPSLAKVSWQGFKDAVARAELQLPLFNPNAEPPPPPAPPATAETPISCPVDCPPPTVNILCQPHPDQEAFPRRIVVKFSAVDEETLNQTYGITEQSVTQWMSQGAPTAIANAARAIRDGIDAATPDPDPALIGQQFANQYDQALDDLELAFTVLFTEQVAAAGSQAAPVVYQIIRDNAWRGLDCRDINLMLSGTFSHLAVSSFMGVTGRGLVSTTGAAGVSGDVNFLGLPVGKGMLFATATDNSGFLNPTVCGDLQVKLPPFEFGRMGGAMKADGCISALLGIFQNFVQAVGPQITGTVLGKMRSDFLGKTMDEALATIVTENPGDPASAVNTFSIAFMGRVLSDPDITLPATLLTEMRAAMGQAFEVMNPEFVFCGQVRPSIFGLETSEALVQAKYRIRKTGREAQFGLSPIGVLLYLMRCDTIFSSVDQAEVGYAEEWPDAAAFIMAGLDGSLANPDRLADLAREQAENILTNSTATFLYQLKPLGMNFANAQGRVIMPDILNHPLLRQTAWVRPGEGSRANWPSRIDLLDAASKQGRLAEVFWKGTPGQLSPLFPNDPAKAAAVATASLRGDYFPHGGFAFAGQINVPRILTTIPKTELALLTSTAPGWDTQQGLVDRLQASLSVVQNYILQTEERGNLAMYVPAPNPPALFDNNGNRIVPTPQPTADSFLASFENFNPNNLSNPELYPKQHGFIKGKLSGQFLDMPIGEAEIEAQPADETGPARFYFHSDVPNGSWADAFLNAGQITARMIGEPELDIDVDFTTLRDQIQSAINSGNQVLRQTVLNEMKAGLNLKLPRAELIATAPTMRTPPGLGSLLTFNGSGEFRAYTPEYDPNANPNSGALAAAKKRGGIAFEGTVKPGPFGDPLTAQLSVTPNSSGLPRLQGSFNLPKLVLPAAGIAPVNFTTTSATIDTGSNGASPSVTINGTLATGFTLPAGWNPWPVVVPAGANVSITNHTMTITFNQSGFGTATVTVNAANPVSPIVTANASVTIPAINTGVVFVEGNSGNLAPITVNVQTNGTATATNARVRIGGSFNRTANLPAFTFDAAKNFSATSISAAQSTTLGGLNFTGLTWQVRRVSGSLSLLNLAGTLSSFPGFNAATQAFSGGTVGTDGSWSMSGTRANLGAGNFILRALSGNLPVAVGSAIPGIRVTNAHLEQGDLFSLFNLGTFDLPTDGSFNRQVSATFSIRGYPLGTASLRFQRVSGVTTLQVESSAFAPTNWPSADALNLTGNISSTGAISLSQAWNTGIGGIGNRDLFTFPLNGSFAMTHGENYSFVLANQAPAGWWQLNESTQSSPLTVLDSSGNGRNGNASPAPTVGQDGARPSTTTYSHRFDGVDDRIYIPHNAAFNGSNVMTVSAWFRVNAFDRSWQTIVAKGDSAWRIARNGTTNQIAFDTNHASGLNSIVSSTNVNNGQWHHVVGIWDGSRKYLYLNGVLEAISTAVNSPINTNIFNIGIGENPQSTGRYWNGWIDEVAFFDRAIDVTEVQRQYASGVGARLTFSGGLNLRQTNPALLTSSFGGHVMPNGAMNFIGAVSGTPTILGFGFNNVSLALSRSAGGSTASCSGAATLNTLKAPGSLGSFNLFGSNPRLNASFTRSGATTSATLSASGLTTALGGYAPTPTGFNLSMTGSLGTNPGMSLSGFNFGPFGTSEITNIGFGSLSGSIFNDGSFFVGQVTRSLTLRNLTAASTTVNFDYTGLSVNGAFALNIQPFLLPEKSFGSISFGGTIQPGGSYTLNGSGSLNIGGFLTNSFAMQFRDPTQGGTIIPAAGVIPNLGFGNLPVPLTNMVINRDGFGYTMQKNGGTGLQNRWVIGGVTWVRDRFDWIVNLTYSFSGGTNGTLTANATGNYFCEFLPAAPKPIGAQTSFSFSASGGISSSGGFTINSSTTGVNNFKCPSWGLPGDPGWAGFNANSFSFDLW
jgi:hypothetical protein